jgi:hypothetical protein
MPILGYRLTSELPYNEIYKLVRNTLIEVFRGQLGHDLAGKEWKMMMSKKREDEGLDIPIMLVREVINRLHKHSAYGSSFRDRIKVTEPYLKALHGVTPDDMKSDIINKVMLSEPESEATVA